MKRKIETVSEKLRQNVNEGKVKERDYQSIIRTTTDGFWIVDSKGRFLDVNDAYCALTGYSREELLNMNIPDIEAVEKPGEVARRIQRIIKTGHDRFETRHRCKDGRIVDIEISTTYAGAGDGRLFVFAREITERKQAEEALQAEKNKLQSVVDAMEYGLTIQDRDYNIIYQNEPLKIVFGDRAGEKCYRAYESREKLCDGCPVEKAFRDGKPHSSERKVIIPSGEVTFWENTANPVRDAGGKIVSCLEITRNVTERKQAEEALQESEERFRSIVENSHAGIMILDDAYRFAYVNDELCRISGYSRKKIIGQDFRQFLDEESRQLVADRYIRRQRGKELPPRYEFNFVHKEGQKRRVEVISNVIRDSAGEVKTVAQILDITERKQAEETLRQSREKLRQMFESVSDGISVIDLHGVITEVNQRMVEMHGFASRDELLGKGAFELVAPGDRERVATNMRKALKRGTIRSVEYTLLKADGTEFPGELSTNALNDASGRWIGHITIARDITGRKQAEEALLESESKFKNLFEHAKDAIILADAQTGILFDANPAACRMLGLPKEKVVGMRQLELHPPEMAAHYERIFRNHAEKGIAVTENLIVQRADGSQVPVDISASVFELRGRRIIQGVFRDITERKQAEEELKLRAQMLDGATDSIWVHDLDENFIYVNEATCRIHGYSREELMKMKLHQLVAPEQVSGLSSLRQEVLEKGEAVFETTHLRKDGSIMPVEIHSRTIEVGGRTVVLAVIRDITERKKAEEELRLRAQMLDSATDSIFVHDLEENFVYVNEATCRTHGYSREEFMKMKLPQVIIPVQASDLSSIRQEMLGEGHVPMEATHLRKDGSIMPVEVRSRAVEVGGRKLILSVIRDITERKRAEEELRLRAQMLDSATDSIWVHDLEENFVYVNEAACRTHGYSREEFMKMKIRQVIAPDQVSGLPLLRQEILEKGKVAFETAHLRKDGSIIPMEVHNRTIELGGRTLILAVQRDITGRKKAEEEEKRLQQELYLSRRLASVGELAAGVAHEINNPLTGVLGFSQRLLRKSTSEEVSRGLEIIHDEAQRAARIVQNLLAFARRRQPRKEYSNINDIVHKTLELRSYALQTSSIEVVTSLAPSLPQVMVDFPQIQEVFLNIIMNAEQAMNEGHGRGKLTIKTREIKGYVRISFADDGPGIPPEQLDKVFDPFFTTREDRGGTGLGLSVCHGIVAEHGGKIYARNKPGKGGTTFFVELPLTPTETSLMR